MVRRWVLAGTGSRGSGMFGKPLATDEVFKGHAELVGLFDISRVRMEYCKREWNKPDLPTYTDFDKMMEELKPDGVIVATTDNTHAQYIVKALELGVDVASEKPICNSAQQCVDLLNAEKASDARCLCTHNMRYGSAVEKMKEVIDSGRIGEIRTMHFREMLDRSHGADYFRRWHGHREFSNGLMLHKSCHHFDLLNYLNGNAKGERITAQGDLSFYGKKGPYRSARCQGCPHRDECEFYTDISTSEKLVGLYMDAEEETGYIRDQCVFNTDIDIQDRVALEYTTENNVLVSYTLCAYAMWEGMEIHIQGTKGLLELVSRSRTLPGAQVEFGKEESIGTSLKLYNNDEGVIEIEIPKAEGGHGGADPRLREEFFIRDRDLPPTPRMASLEEAVQAVLVGLGAVRSIDAGGEPQDIQAPIAGI